MGLHRSISINGLIDKSSLFQLLKSFFDAFKNPYFPKNSLGVILHFVAVFNVTFKRSFAARLAKFDVFSDIRKG